MITCRRRLYFALPLALIFSAVVLSLTLLLGANSRLRKQNSMMLDERTRLLYAAETAQQHLLWQLHLSQQSEAFKEEMSDNNQVDFDGTRLPREFDWIDGIHFEVRVINARQGIDLNGPDSLLKRHWSKNFLELYPEHEQNLRDLHRRITDYSDANLNALAGADEEGFNRNAALTESEEIFLLLSEFDPSFTEALSSMSSDPIEDPDLFFLPPWMENTSSYKPALASISWGQFKLLAGRNNSHTRETWTKFRQAWLEDPAYADQQQNKTTKEELEAVTDLNTSFGYFWLEIRAYTDQYPAGTRLRVLHPVNGFLSRRSGKIINFKKSIR